jgi:hypothetical protein
MYTRHRRRWGRWLRACGLSSPLISALLETDLATLKADSRITCNQPPPAVTPPLKGRLTHARLDTVRRRAIRAHTGRMVRVLRDQGFSAGRIGEILALDPKAVSDFLQRVTGRDGEALSRPRTGPEQHRLDQNARRRAKRQAAAALAAAGRWPDVGRNGRPLPEPDAPAAPELVEAPPPAAAAPAPAIVPTELAAAPLPEVPGPGHWNRSDTPTLYGEQKGSSKLTWAAVDDIRRLYGTGKLSPYALARRFGVSRGAILAVLTNRTWREETRPPPVEPPLVPPPAATKARTPKPRPHRWRPIPGDR